MKRTYEEPKTKFVKTRGAEAVADTCWGHAANGGKLYYNTSGPGYAIITLTTNGGCAGADTINPYIEYVDVTLGEETKKRAEIDAAIAKSNGSNAQSFKGSPFEKEANPSWS